MATHCAKCGVELQPGQQFCPDCGAPAPTETVAAAPAPAAAPAKSGMSALKIVLIIIVVIVGLGILGLGVVGFGIWRVAHAFHADSKNGEASITTPQGTFTANQSKQYTPSDLGTEIYPGAQAGHGGMNMELPTGSMVTAIYVTSDSKDQVVAFYKDKFGSGASVIDSSDGAIVSLKKSEQESVMVTVTQNSAKNEGKTQIAIVHTKSNKSS